MIVGFIFIKGIGKINLSFLFADYSASGNGGILPMIITTVYMVLVAILVATPIGILASVYLQEYAKQGKVVRVIRFATECFSRNTINSIWIIWWDILCSSTKTSIFHIIRWFNCSNYHTYQQ